MRLISWTLQSGSEHLRQCHWTAGGRALIRRDLIPSQQVKESRMEKQNWVPLSQVICCGTPNQATQPLTSAALQLCTEAEQRGTTSTCLVEWSRKVRR
jgi:hypothetical protein